MCRAHEAEGASRSSRQREHHGSLCQPPPTCLGQSRTCVQGISSAQVHNTECQTVCPLSPMSCSCVRVFLSDCASTAEHPCLVSRESVGSDLRTRQIWGTAFGQHRRIAGFVDMEMPKHNIAPHPPLPLLVHKTEIRPRRLRAFKPLFVDLPTHHSPHSDRTQHCPPCLVTPCFVV